MNPSSPPDAGTAQVLIVGGDSMVGRHLAARLRAEGLTVHGTTRRAERAGGTSPLLDLATGDGFGLAGRGYRVAYLSAAVARLGDCRSDPHGSRAVNVTGTVALARRLAANGTRVVYLSTDKVFDGTRPGRRPEEPPCPATEYGRQKAEAEAAVLALASGAVLRLTKVVHAGMPLFEGWRADLGAGRPVAPFSDLMMAPVTATRVAELLARLGAAPAADGVFHLSATDDVSYAEAARFIAARTGADSALVQPVEGAVRALGGEAPSAFTILDMTATAARFGMSPTGPMEAVAACLGAVS